MGQKYTQLGVEERCEIARFDIQTDIVHRNEIAEAARDISDFELGHVGLPGNLHRHYCNRYCTARSGDKFKNGIRNQCTGDSAAEYFGVAMQRNPRIKLDSEHC